MTENTKEKTTKEPLRPINPSPVTGLASPPVESKAEKFRRLGTMRVTKVIKTLRHIGNLFTTNYQWTTEQADKVVSLISDELAAIKSRIAGKKDDSGGISL